MTDSPQIELIICDDDALQRQELAADIHTWFPAFMIREISGARDLQCHLARGVSAESRRIYLMDVILENGEDGIDLARHIHRIDPEAPIIFISAYLEKACDVYDVEHCYFVYKPQKDQRLKAAVSRALDLLEPSRTPLVVHEGTAVHRVNPSSILCMERVRRCTYITCVNQVFKAQEDLTKLLEQLPESFAQCHRSYVVNFARTAAFYGTEFEMSNGLRIPVARSRQNEIRRRYSRFLQKEQDLC